MRFVFLAFSLAMLGHRSHAGFLNQSPFTYFVNAGAPFTSVASPYFDFQGFGSPQFSPLVNFYHPQPVLKTLYHPVFYQFPEFINLPAPKFYSLPQASPTTAPSEGYPSAPAEREEQKVADQQQLSPPAPEYGLPTQRSSTGPSQGRPFSSFNTGRDSRNNEYTTGPSRSSSSELGVYEDDFRGDRESVVVNANRPRDPPANNNFQSFIVNRAARPTRTERPEYIYRDNSVQIGRQRASSGAQPTAQGGYA